MNNIVKFIISSALFICSSTAVLAQTKAAYNCNWQLLLGYNFGPQYDNQFVGQFIAGSQNEAVEMATNAANSYGWSRQGVVTCTFLVAIP